LDQLYTAEEPISLAFCRPITCHGGMLDANRFKLRFGPYLPPRCKVGRLLRCALRGMVKVTGISDAPIPWPQTSSETGGGRRFLIGCGSLVPAIRRESNQPVAQAASSRRQAARGQ